MSFTFQYSQHPEYHFSLDSVEGPRRIATRLNERGISSVDRALDLCAGCGVMGLETLFHFPAIQSFDFLELQAANQIHLERNTSELQKQFSATTMNLNFGDFRNWNQTFGVQIFDLIVCNPPFFLPGQGKLSPSDFKNRSRFFMDGDPQGMVEAILGLLKPGSLGYVLIRDQSQHGLQMLKDIDVFCRGRARVEVLGPVRTTSLVEIHRNSSSPEM